MTEQSITEDIAHDINNDGGRYWLGVDGSEAELTYVNRGNSVIVADHTFVPPEARGGDIALRLVTRLVDDARRKNLKIVPQCPYIDKVFKRNPDWDALRA